MSTTEQLATDDAKLFTHIILELVQRHQESYMRRELQWEATVDRLQQQLAQLKGEGDHKAAEDAAEGQAKQLNSIRSCSHTQAICHQNTTSDAPQ